MIRTTEKRVRVFHSVEVCTVSNAFFKVAVGPKRSTNKNLKQIITIECTKTYISASTAPKHLKIGKERAYTMIYHKMDLFLSRTNYVSNNIA